jgi:hypothetical protein
VINWESDTMVQVRFAGDATARWIKANEVSGDARQEYDAYRKANLDGYVGTPRQRVLPSQKGELHLLISVDGSVVSSNELELSKLIMDEEEERKQHAERMHTAADPCV